MCIRIAEEFIKLVISVVYKYGDVKVCFVAVQNLQKTCKNSTKTCRKCVKIFLEIAEMHIIHGILLNHVQKIAKQAKGVGAIR